MVNKDFHCPVHATMFFDSQTVVQSGGAAVQRRMMGGR